LVSGEYYHIYNHGVDDRKVFENNTDFMRAAVNLTVFNDAKSSPGILSRFVKDPSKLIDSYMPDNRERLIDIIAFTLNSNHYHLFVRQKAEKGISRFMHSFDKGYARYFNLKNDRRGALWEGSFGIKLIDNESYFFHIMDYVHLNVLDNFQPKWRDGRIENWERAAVDMKNYIWSSYPYYRTGTSQIPFMNLIITRPDWLKEYCPKPEDFEKSVHLWSMRNTL